MRSSVESEIFPTAETRLWKKHALKKEQNENENGFPSEMPLV